MTPAKGGPGNQRVARLQRETLQGLSGVPDHGESTPELNNTKVLDLRPTRVKVPKALVKGTSTTRGKRLTILAKAGMVPDLGSVQPTHLSRARDILAKPG